MEDKIVQKGIARIVEAIYEADISGNSRRVRQFGYVTIRTLYKWLNRRSQRRSFMWEPLNAYLTH